MDTHITGQSRVTIEAVIASPKPETIRGRELAERIEADFPRELRKLPRWVGWRWEFSEKRGKWTKPPIWVGMDRHASSTNPETWTTFEKAVAALKRSDSTLDGIGLVLVKDDKLAGIDVDHPPDHPTSKLVIRSFAGTFCERSPRGNLRVWCFGTPKHSGRNAKAEVEVYGADGRYLTVTGDHIETTAAEVTSQQEELDWLHQRFFPEPQTAPAPQQQVGKPNGNGRHDRNILERARASKHGAKFSALYDQGCYHGGLSEDTAALCSMLAFWTQNPDEIDRLFRASALMRPKWDDRRGNTTWGRREIEKAIARTPETFDWNRDTRKSGNRKGNGAALPPHDPETGEVHQPEIAINEAIQPLNIFGDPDIVGFPELTQNCLPTALYDFAVLEAERIGTDPVVMAAHALAACGASIGSKWRVQPKEHDREWTQGANLWVCVIKDVGTRGTDAINSAFKPLRKREAIFREEHELEKQRWAQRNPEHRKKDFVASPDDPMPVARRLITNDASVEKLSDLLSEGPTDKIAYVADELASFLDFGRYSSSKGGGDAPRACMLQAYDGGPYSVDRVIRGCVHVKNWEVGVSGNIQYRKLQKLARLLTDDGLWQRFCKFHAKPVPHREDDDIPQNSDHVADYEALHNMLLAIRPADGGTSTLVFGKDARSERRLFRRLIGRLTQDTSVPVIVRETASKWEGLLASEISGPTVTKAANFIRQIILPNLFRVGFETMPEEGEIGDHARWIGRYILSRGLKAITMREVGRAYRDLRGNPQAIQRAMAFLEDAAWVTQRESGRHDSVAWDVNPALNTVFAQQARAEKARREKVRELIRIKVSEL